MSFLPEGYGDRGSAEGHGCPVFLERFEGRLWLVVVPDINSELPSIIELELARENRLVEASIGP